MKIDFEAEKYSSIDDSAHFRKEADFRNKNGKFGARSAIGPQ
jgi:hypothetical protein